MRVFVFSFIIFSIVPLMAQDFKLDPKTSRAIPTFQGTVLLIHGEAKRINAENPDGTFLEKGQRVFSKDKIETAEKSLIKIQMTDQTIIALGPKSSFEISQYEFQGIDERKAIFVLLRGQLRANVFQKAKEGDLQFKTKSISMGVRGTEFLANEFEETEVALLTGKLLMTNLSDKKNKDLYSAQYYLKANQEIKVTNLDPEEVKRLQAAQLKEDEVFKPFLEIRKKEEKKKDEEVVLNAASNPIKNEATDTVDDQWKKVLELLNRRLRENNNR